MVCKPLIKSAFGAFISAASAKLYVYFCLQRKISESTFTNLSNRKTFAFSVHFWASIAISARIEDGKQFKMWTGSYSYVDLKLNNNSMWIIVLLTVLSTASFKRNTGNSSMYRKACSCELDDLKFEFFCTSFFTWFCSEIISQKLNLSKGHHAVFHRKARTPLNAMTKRKL